MSIYLSSKKDFMNFAIMIFCFFFIFSCLTVTDIKAQTLLSEKIVWKPAEYVDPGKEVKVIPFKIKGPGVLQINSTIEPFFCVKRPMRYDGVFGIPGIWNYDWKLVKAKHLYDGKPREHYNVATPCYLEGKIKKATFFDEFEIPAKQYSGEFVITSPMSCSFNSCDRRGATFWAEVKFIPGSTTPSGEGEKESYLPGGPEVNGTSWIVNNHPVPWVFRSDGTVEAPNLWKGTWRRTNEGYWVNIGNGADVFLVKFSPDGKSFTAYKNGAVYRRGVFKSSSPDIQSSEPPQQKTVYFEKPTYKGYRLDICRLWGAECGKEAADAFCRIKGFTHSESWEIDHDIGHIYPTIIISSEQICNQSFCDGFKFIKCAG
ncbi:MAG: hypothetical protein N2645_15130, partial [Clostridia bacterium]|nr:hypothetical protein [Clostridia bacterium]